MALYRKYRPATFAEVVGQHHVTDPLSAALESRDSEGNPNRINHAYLFSGPRGCGKTSSARIMARSLNCVNGPTATPCGVCDSCRALAPGGSGNLDVIELDAASNRGVEQMRELRDQAVFQPSDSRYRIFIIDEAHMITKEGANALLKIVEEPPEHLIFIFATTEPEKILPTIRSRTHHYPFRLLTPPDMRGLLERVVASEGVQVDPDVYPMVVQAGGGSPRDALSVMDQLIAGSGPNGVEYDTSAAILGVTDSSLLTEAVQALGSGDRAGIFGVVNRVIMSGQDPAQFSQDLLKRVRDLMVLGTVPEAVEQGLVDIPVSQIEEITSQAGMIPPATLTRFSKVLSEGSRDFRGVTSPRLLLEVLCARMLLPAAEDTLEGLLQRIESLERGLPSGGAGAGAGLTTPTSSPANAQPAGGAGVAASSGASAAEAGDGFAGAGGVAGDAGAGVASGAGAQAGMSARERLRMQRQNREAKANGGKAGSGAQTGTQRDAQRDVQTGTQRDAQPETAPAQPRGGEAVGQGGVVKPAEAETPAEETPEERRARLIKEQREAARRAQEIARQQERAERERLAHEREAAVREREGEAGAIAPGWNEQRETEPVNVAVPEPQDAAVSGAAGTAAAGSAEQRSSAIEPNAAETVSRVAEPNVAETVSRVAEPEEPRRAEAMEGASGSSEDSVEQVGIEQVAARWSEILAALEGEHATAVRILAQQAKPLELSEEVLTIGHSTGALVNRLNDEAYSQALGAAVRNTLGLDVRVQCVIGVQGSGVRAAGVRAAGARSRDHKAGPEQGQSGAADEDSSRSSAARNEPSLDVERGPQGESSLDVERGSRGESSSDSVARPDEAQGGTSGSGEERGGSAGSGGERGGSVDRGSVDRGSVGSSQAVQSSARSALSHMAAQRAKMEAAKKARDEQLRRANAESGANGSNGSAGYAAQSAVRRAQAEPGESAQSVQSSVREEPQRQAPRSKLAQARANAQNGNARNSGGGYNGGSRSGSDLSGGSRSGSDFNGGGHSYFDDVPPPPEPMDEYGAPPECDAPPEFGDSGYGQGNTAGQGGFGQHNPGAQTNGNVVPQQSYDQFGGQPGSGQQRYGQQGQRHQGLGRQGQNRQRSGQQDQAPDGYNQNGGGQPSTPDDSFTSMDEEEMLRAASEPGTLDHRDMKEVVMELLAKELGAKPL